LQSVIATQAAYEFQPAYSRALNIAVYVGMLLGALFWGMSADIIGRRFAFNVSLFICSIFSTVAGAAPNWVALATFIGLLGFGGGGNLILDTTVFLEYLPSHKQWVLSTYLAKSLFLLARLNSTTFLLTLTSIPCCLVGTWAGNYRFHCLGILV
jgi:MFS family permease